MEVGKRRRYPRAFRERAVQTDEELRQHRGAGGGMGVQSLGAASMVGAQPILAPLYRTVWRGRKEG